MTKGALLDWEYVSHVFDEHWLEDTGLCGALPTLVGGHHYRA